MSPSQRPASLHLGTAPTLGPSFPQQPVLASAPSSVHVISLFRRVSSGPPYSPPPQLKGHPRLRSLQSSSPQHTASTSAALLHPSEGPAEAPFEATPSLRSVRAPPPHPQPRPSLAAPPRAHFWPASRPRPSPSPRPPRGRSLVPDESTSCACPNSREFAPILLVRDARAAGLRVLVSSRIPEGWKARVGGGTEGIQLENLGETVGTSGVCGKKGNV